MVDSTRPKVPAQNPDAELHRRQLADRVNAALMGDATEAASAPVLLREYTVAGVPTASLYEGGIIYVSDETGGATLAFSDGTNWRRVQDRAVVS